MYLTKIILFVIHLQVKSEWIEISQQHYIKPFGSQVNHNVNKQATLHLQETNEKKINKQDILIHSKNDHPFTKGNILRVHNVGVVKRVQSVDRPQKLEQLIETNNSNEDIELISQKDTLKQQRENHENISEAIEAKINQDNHTNIKNVTKNNTFNELNVDTKENNSSSKINNNKVNKLENILKFLKVVADTISKNTKRSFNSKVKYLQKLRKSISLDIEERIDARWPEEALGGRTARSATAGGRGHVDFPSSESTLMTISFLTFAVFLIKLVLQVIQTYKNKTMMVAPAVFAVSRATARDTTGF